MKNLAGKNVLVLGLGASGLAMARWCAQYAAKVWVADTREAPPALAELANTDYVHQAANNSLVPIAFIAGEFKASYLQEYGIHAVFKSPGLSPEHVKDIWSEAKSTGIYCGGELSLFAQAMQDLREEVSYSPKILAITGTNGKTTVTSLTASLVAETGAQVVAAGNIGPTMLDTLREKIGANTLPDAWVLELSSFQLDSLNDSDGFNPSAACILNLSEDHLDWHGSMEHYLAAKAKIFGAHTLRVLNRDDLATAHLQPAAVLRRGKSIPVRFLSFGVSQPSAADQFGLEKNTGMTWLVRSLSAEESDGEVVTQRMMPAGALRIHGQHNALNALAALALCLGVGYPLTPLLYALREYKGESHRVESVAILDEVEYFDDSKGTNVGATVAALVGLGQSRRLVVILGGDGKGQNFAPLAMPIAAYARAVVLIGKDAPLIEEALRAIGVPLSHAADMAAAVLQAKTAAQVGDAVLLSPACASLDMYKDYTHRAQTFIDEVHALGGAA